MNSEYFAFPKPVKVPQRLRKKLRPKRKRIKLTPIPKLVRKADSVFSKWIRRRDDYRCVLCGSILNITCGHLIKRGKKLTRYDVFNCNALCSSCNWKDNFEHDHYVRWFLNKYPQYEYERLVDLSLQEHKWTREELYGIIEKYSIPLDK